MNESFKERQDRENQKYYEKWKACGFSGPMKVNEYGWFVPVLRLHYPVETITVFDNKGYRGKIEYCQLPNGAWVAASNFSAPTHGFGSACSVWDPQYETKNEAIIAELDKIEKALEAKDCKPFILEALLACRNRFKIPLLSMAFEQAAKFEQVALF